MADRYVHVSVQVGRNASGALLRTPPGKGATARRSKEQEYLKRRDVRKEIKRMIREANKVAQAEALAANNEAAAKAHYAKGGK